MDKLLQNEFGFTEVEIKRLDGYENANYRITTDSDHYIFKTYKYVEKENLIDLVKSENETLIFLQKTDSKKYPKPIPFLDGSHIKMLTIDGEKKICRMLTFLDGELLGDIKPTKELFQSFGSFLAETDIKLQKLSNYTI